VRPEREMETPEGWRGSPSNSSAEGQAPDVLSLVARCRSPRVSQCCLTPSRSDRPIVFPERVPSAFVIKAQRAQMSSGWTWGNKREILGENLLGGEDSNPQ
jgi:hypothetical protein